MKKVITAAVIVTVLTGLPALALAIEKTVEGTIQSVDSTGQTVTLVGGLTLDVPPGLSTESLEPGEDVTIIYQDDGNGDPSATAIWIEGGSNAGGK